MTSIVPAALTLWRAGVLLLLAALTLGAQAQNWETGTDGLAPIPPLTARVTDRTGTLSDAERAALEDKLARYEQSSGNQLVVLLVPSTRPEPIEAYSIRVAEAWKIGRKGSDNGVLFVVAKNDRKMRIEVGYGLEGVLTDAQASRIIAETVAPQFRNNRFAAGIDAGVDRIIALTGSGGSPPAQRAARPSGGGDFETWLVVLLVIVPVVGGILKRIFGRFMGSLFGGGLVGGGAWLIAGSIGIAVVAALAAFVVLLFLGLGGGSFGRRGGMYIPTGGWGGGLGRGGFGGGGGGFSGGGGSFGGGGASGGW